LVGIVMIVTGVWHTKTLPSPKPGTEKQPSVSEAFTTFGDVVKTFFQKKNVWWAIAFICLFRFSEGNQVKIVPLFMRAEREVGGLGLSTSDVGLAYGLVGSLAFVLGSLAGGYMTSRRGLRRSLLILCAMFNVPNVMYAVLAFTQPESMWGIMAAVWLETFGYGFGFVGVTLFMMQELAPGPYRMAHYAFGTAIMFLGFLAPSSFSGYISDALGYQMHFVWVLIATIPSFFVAWRVPITNEPARTGPA
jgi:PAT family beta-lactamase induction signal transducer AmpG